MCAFVRARVCVCVCVCVRPSVHLSVSVCDSDGDVGQANHGITHVLIPAFLGHQHRGLLHVGRVTYLMWPVMDVKDYPIIWVRA